MEKEVKINLEQVGNEFIIRHGQALPEREPQKVAVDGAITAPRLWIDKRKEAISPEKSYLAVSKESAKIQLVVDERSYYADVINGQMLMNPEINKLGINDEQRVYSNLELAKVFKMNRALFAGKAENLKVVSELQNVKAKVEREREVSDDNRGSMRATLAQKVIKSNIPEYVTLEMPIFKGMGKVKFKVEIYVDPQTFDCSLISPDLEELREQEIEEHIEKEVDAIKILMPDLPVLFI